MTSTTLSAFSAMRLSRLLSNAVGRTIRRLHVDEGDSGLIKVAELLKADTCKRCVVMAGAGISTPSGIPDFRSAGTGIYDNLQKYNLPYPEAIFDLVYFRTNPKPFMQFAKELYPDGSRYRPNAVHYFIRLLQEKGLLLRMFTQNIDGLERLAGIHTDALIEAHGTFASATCQHCGKQYTGADIKADIFKDTIPICREERCTGVIKPDVVFFGEMLPDRFLLCQGDLSDADMLLVMGTSLEVYPFANLAEFVSVGVPRVLLNRDIAGSFSYSRRPNDIVITGDLLKNVTTLCEHLNWTKDLQEIQANNEPREE